MDPRPFLTARWRYLAMLNYEVPPEALAPLVPAGTELDSWQGKTFVSVVGFLFLDTRVLGIAIPGHRDFEEVNLRFYVRRKAAGRLAARRGLRQGDRPRLRHRRHGAAALQREVRRPADAPSITGGSAPGAACT